MTGGDALKYDEAMWGKQKYVFTLALASGLMASNLVPVLAANTVTIQPLVGETFTTAEGVAFPLEVVGMDALYPASSPISFEIVDPNSALETSLPAQFINANGVKRKSIQSNGKYFVASPLQTGTAHPGGLVTQNLTLTASGSPYRFQRGLEIRQGVTLTVEAGVTLDFSEASFPIWSLGTVNFLGTAQNPIFITGSNRSEEAFFRLSNQNTINHTHVFGPGYGQFINLSGGSLQLTNSVVNDFGQAFNLGWGTTATITGNEFVSSGGFNIYSRESIVIEDNLVDFADKYGSLFSYSSKPATTTFTGNTVKNFRGEFIVARAAGVMDLGGNYWPGKSAADLQNFIFDYNDSIAYQGEVDLEPLLDSNAGSPVNRTYNPHPQDDEFSITYRGKNVLVLFSKVTNLTNSVTITPFRDLNVNGSKDAGEELGLSRTVVFSTATDIQADLSMWDPEQGATYVSALLDFSPPINSHSMFAAAVKVEFVHSSLGVVASSTTPWTRGEGLSFGVATPPLVSGNIFARAFLNGVQIASSEQTFIDSISISDLDIAGPNVLIPGTTAAITVTPRDEYGNAIIIPQDHPRGVDLTYSGPGFVVGPLNNRKTDSNGQIRLYVLLGSNDTGEVQLTASYGRIYRETFYQIGEDANAPRRLTISVFADNSSSIARLPQAEVKLVGEDDTHLLNTDGNGQVEFVSIPAGTYDLLISPPQGAAGIGKFTGVINYDGSNQMRNFTLRPIETGNQSFLGRVLDQFGDGVPQAQVSLTIVGGATHVTTSDSDGYFAIRSLPIGEYRYRISKVGHVAVDSPITLNFAEEQGDEITLPSQTENSLTVSVTDVHSDQPLRKGTLSYEASNGQRHLAGELRANSAGDFVIHGIPEDMVGELMSLTLFDRGNERLIGFWKQVEIQPGHRALSLEAESFPEGAGVISGQVKNRTTNAPIAGASVTLNINFPAVSGPPNYGRLVTRSDASGYYRFVDLPEDTNFSIYAEALISDDTFSSYRNVSFHSAPWDVVADVEIDVPTSGGNASLSGLVVDSQGDPVAQARVSAQLSTDLDGNILNNRLARNVYTDSDGAYAITGLAAGEYTISVSKEDYDQFGRERYKSGMANQLIQEIVVVRSPFDQVSVPTVELEEYAQGLTTLRGQVWNVTTQQPASGVYVSLEGESATFPGASTVVDSQGYYEFSGLPGGLYSIRTWQTAGYSSPEPVNVLVPSSGIRLASRLDIRSIQSGNASLRLLLRDSTTLLPLEGGSATISMKGSHFYRQVSVGLDGWATFSNLPTGEYWISGSAASGYSFVPADANRTAIIREGQNVSSTSVLVVNGTGVLSGRVLDEYDDPVANATVSAGFSIAYGCCEGDGFGLETSTDSQGYYKLRGLPTGMPLNFVVGPEGYHLGRGLYATYKSTINIPPGVNELERNVTLAEKSSISGSVSLAGRGIGNVRVVVEEVSSGTEIGEATSRSDGKWLVRGLPPGQYRVNVRGISSSSRVGHVAAGYVKRTTVSAATSVDFRGDSTVFTTVAGNTLLIPDVALNVGSVLQAQVLQRLSDGREVSLNRGAAVEIYKQNSLGEYLRFTALGEINSYTNQSPELVITALPAGNYKFKLVDQWAFGSVFDPVFQDGSDNQLTALPVLVGAGESLTINPIVVRVPAPRIVAPVVSLTALSADERAAKRDKVLAAVSGSRVSIVVGLEYANQYVAISSTGSFSSQAAFRASAYSTWVLVKDDGTIDLEYATGDIVVADPQGRVLGWTTLIGQAPPAPTPSLGGGGGGGGGPVSQPLVISRPFFTGSLTSGSTITSDVGSWQQPENLVFKYRWHRCNRELVAPDAQVVQLNCSAVFGSELSSYQVSDSDQGKALLLEVIANDKTGKLTSEARAFSDAIFFGKIAAKPNVIIPTPVGESKTWAKRLANGTQAKLYAKNIIGRGKVSLRFNGKEIAWVNALTADDKKIKIVGSDNYFLRTVNLIKGKNILEIYVDGKRTARTIYSR